jgi:hypothetical protein
LTLYLGKKEGKELVYAGKIGSRFSQKTSMSVRKQSLSTEGELFLSWRWPGFRRTAGAFRRRFASSRNPVFHHCHSAELKRRVVGLTAIAGCPHEKFSAVRQPLDQGDGV